MNTDEFTGLEVLSNITIGSHLYIKVKETNIEGDFYGYLDGETEKLIGNFYHDIGNIQEKNGSLYFDFSYLDGSFGLYDISNRIELKDVMLGDISIKESGQHTKGLSITSGFDAIGNTTTLNGKQYMPIKIGEHEGIYCHTDKIIIGDLYDQLGFIKEPYGEYKSCNIRQYNKKYSFVVKKGWKFGDVDLETGKLKFRSLFDNIMFLLGF